MKKKPKPYLCPYCQKEFYEIELKLIEEVLRPAIKDVSYKYYPEYPYSEEIRFDILLERLKGFYDFYSLEHPKKADWNELLYEQLLK